MCDEFERLLGAGLSRPRQLPVRTLLAAQIATMMDGSPPFYTRVWHNLLALPIDDRLTHRVTIEGADGSLHHLTYRQVEYLAGRINLLVDATPVPRRRSGETRAEMLARATAGRHDHEVARTLEERLNWLCDQLLEGTLPPGLVNHPDHAVDGTDVESPAAPKKGSGRSADSNAVWLRRPSTTPGIKDENYQGYKETTAVLVRSERGPAIPELCRSVRLTTSEDEAKTALAIFADMRRRGVPVGDVLADTKYSYSLGWSLTMREMGYALVVNLHTNDRAQRGTDQGAIEKDGTLFCPETPDQLLDLPVPTNDAERRELDPLWKLRGAYRFQTKGKADADGYQRMQCPAERGAVRCPIVRHSMAAPLDRPTILDPPEHPGPACTQSSITVPPTVAAKTKQKHPFGSPQWRESFNRRTTVERDNGRIEDRSLVDLSRGSFRVMGQSKIQLTRVLGHAANNLRMLEAHLSTLPRHQRVAAALLDLPDRPRKTRARRRTDTYQTILG